MKISAIDLAVRLKDRPLLDCYLPPRITYSILRENKDPKINYNL